MKTKLEMAHDYLRDIVSNWEYDDSFDPVAEAWKYADAMQAEVDKRENKEQSEHVFEAIEEWQPDWSQAPEWAIAWTFDRNETLWWSEIPEIHRNFWFIDGGIWKCAEAPSFGYTGDWRNSLRKRPK